MLQMVDVGKWSIDSSDGGPGAACSAKMRTLAEPLRGLRVLHLNATPYGGGVAEILRSEVPLLRHLGLQADWKLISGDKQFFDVTKAIHNGLQGAKRELTKAEQETYLTFSTRNAQLLEEEYDIVFVHDPQPLALLQFCKKGSAKWVWRCHIDTSEPNSQVWNFLRPHLQGYDAAVFTLSRFVPPQFPVQQVAFILPAIDPESPKNLDIDVKFARRLLHWIGVEIDRPLITQVSRFDPWKDPLGVIAAFRLVKEKMPDVQLALVGSMALDDPEGWEMYRQIQEEAQGDPSIDLHTNLTGVGNIEVNAFQRLSSVVIQKSLREGFGLVVSEAMWKGTPVVARRAGGIPQQLQDGIGGFLVDSIEECAERILSLLTNPEQAKAIGAKGREVVRERFLLHRLIEDELQLMTDLLADKPLCQSNTVRTSTRSENGCGDTKQSEEGDPIMEFQLTSTAIQEGDGIPVQYTGDGKNLSPPLKWTDPPKGTKSLALVCIDPDAPRGTFTHWVAFNLPAESRELSVSIPPEATLPNGTIQGTNDFGKIGYAGPAPPPGKAHRYFFKLFALDTMLDLQPGASHEDLRAATPGHVLAEGQLMGTYQR